MWKNIRKGRFAGLYAVSSTGHVKSLRTARILKPDEYTSNSKYMRVTLSESGKTKRYALHRLVALAFLDNPYNKPQVNHKDGDRWNNDVSNLEWCTQKENQTHAVETGLCPKGEDNGNSRYTKHQIRQVKYYSHLGHSRKDVANLCNVTLSCVKDVRSGRVWKDL